MKREYSRERLNTIARLARVVAVDVPHHITQRGNARRFMLDCDADRKIYLDLLREDIESCRVSLIGWSGFTVCINRSKRSSRGFPPKKTTPRDLGEAAQL